MKSEFDPVTSVLFNHLIDQTAAVTEIPEGAALIPPTGAAFHLLALLASDYLGFSSSYLLKSNVNT